MIQRTRGQLFVDEGLDPETARIAAKASDLPPEERTDVQRLAISKISNAIAENNRKLVQTEEP